ncbi:hypothetical protein [Actinomadura sp. NBRC 104412]|nr:hypothetical protein [Actinomadura sp. NBRC 104412]
MIPSTPEQRPLSRCCRAPVLATLRGVRCSQCTRSLPPHLIVAEVL